MGGLGARLAHQPGGTGKPGYGGSGLTSGACHSAAMMAEAARAGTLVREVPVRWGDTTPYAGRP